MSGFRINSLIELILDPKVIVEPILYYNSWFLDSLKTTDKDKDKKKRQVFILSGPAEALRRMGILPRFKKQLLL